MRPGSYGSCLCESNRRTHSTSVLWRGRLAGFGACWSLGAAAIGHSGGFSASSGSYPKDQNDKHDHQDPDPYRSFLHLSPRLAHDPQTVLAGPVEEPPIEGGFQGARRHVVHVDLVSVRDSHVYP